MKRNNKRAFTIVELVIVITVIAVLAAVLIPTFSGVIENANDSKAMQSAKNAYTSYMIESNGSSPEYMIYDAEGRFVALHKGVAVGVYDSKEEALKAMLGEEADPSKLTGNDKLLVYNSENVKEILAGKKISFMGDSITTYLNWSNNASFNSTLPENGDETRVYYERAGKKGLLTSVNYTWWMQTVDNLGLKLCVNNSWTGSTVIGAEGSTSAGCGDTRTSNLHNDNTNENPDIIVIYMGTNDVNKGESISTFTSAYNMMVSKIKTNYPNADIYLCTVDNYTFNLNRNPVAYNEVIKSIAAEQGCTVVDFYNETPICPETIETYTVSDNVSYRLHPNAKGTTEMYKCVRDALAKKYQIAEADDQPIFSRDVIQNLKVSGLTDSNTNIYMYMNDTVNQSLSGKTVTRIGVPIKSVKDYTKDSYFTVYVVDSTAPHIKHGEYKITIPANRFSANTINQWAYLDVNIKLEEGQTLAFQPDLNASAVLGYAGKSYTSVVSEIGGFQRIDIVTGEVVSTYTDITILYDIYFK